MSDQRDPRRMDGSDGLPDHDPVADELVRYGALTDQHPSPGFTDRVMAAIEAEPAPARGGLAAAFAGWLGQLAGPARQSLRMAALATVVVLAVGGALVGAQLSGILRQGPPSGTSASPVPTPAVTVSPTPTAVPSPTLVPSPTPTPESSDGASPQAQETAQSQTRSPRPSSSEGGSHETPDPTETPKPSASSGDG